MSHVQLDDALTVICELLKDMSFDEIKEVEMSSSSQVLFDRWCDRQSFGKVPQLKEKLLHLIHHQRGIRKTFLVTIEIEAKTFAKVSDAQQKPLTPIITAIANYYERHF